MLDRMENNFLLDGATLVCICSLCHSISTLCRDVLQSALLSNIDYEGVIKAEAQYANFLCLNVNDNDDIEAPGPLCRLCANNSPDAIYIYGTVGEELNIASKINLSLPVMVKKTDPLPKQVCSSCVTKLNICYEFAEASLKAEEKLKALMKVKQSWEITKKEMKHVKEQYRKEIPFADLELKHS